MPLYLDPNQRIRIVLESDREKHGEKAPVFVFKPMTGRMSLALQQQTEALTDNNSLEQIFKFLQAILDRVESVPGGPQASGTDLLDMLTPGEALELQTEYMAKADFGVADKKKLESQSKSETGSSATNAAADSVATLPPISYRPSSNVPSVAATGVAHATDAAGGS
ncbi:MAG: hypothetical protein ACP5I8_13245 [Phycisphaerae bacterium]